MASFGTFVRYALSQLGRRRRRTFSALVGIALAVALIAAENIAIDSSARTVIERQLEKIPVDLEARTFGTRDYLQVTSLISGVRNVERVEPVSAYHIAGLIQPNGTGNSFYIDISGVRPEFSQVAKRFGFEGQFDLKPGGIVISEFAARATGLGQGDPVSVVRTVMVYNSTLQQYVYHNYTVNLTVSSIISTEHFKEGPAGNGMMEDASPPKDAVSPYGISESGGTYQKDMAAFVLLSEIGSIAGQLGSGDAGSPNNSNTVFNHSFHYCIWIDRLGVINAFDLDTSKFALTMLKQRISFAGDVYRVEVTNDNLMMALMETTAWLNNAKMMFPVLSLPVIGLGLYLGLLGVDLGMAERRQEVAVLKARGATRGNIVWLFLVEGILLGIIAGLAGLLIGLLLSQVMIQMIVPGASAGLYLTAGSALLAVLLGVLLMMAAMYRPARRASRMEITEGLQYYSTEESIEKYNPKNSVIMVAVASLFFCVDILFNPQTWISGGNAPDTLYMVLSVLYFIGMLMSPVIPIMLIFGITSLLTRASYKPYDYISRITKPLTGEMWHVVNRNIVRNPKRASRVAIIIAMGITFGIFVTSMIATQEQYDRNAASMAVGADIHLEFYSSRGGGINTSIQSALANISGVERVVQMHLVSTSVVNAQTDLVLLDARNYTKVVAAGTLSLSEAVVSDIPYLAGGKRALINEQFATSTGARPGDNIKFKVQLADELTSIDVSSRVVSGLKALPGAVQFYSPGSPIGEQSATAYMDISNVDLASIQAGKSVYLIKVASGASLSAVENAIRSRFSFRDGFERMITHDEWMSALSEDPLSSSLSAFLVLENAYTIIILTAGLGIILLAAVLERERETATTMARGASRNQVASLFVSESLTIQTLAIVIGTLTGILTAFTFNSLMSMGSTGIIERSLTFSYTTGLLVAGTVVSLVIVSFLVARKAARVDIIKVLRLRGG